ncbi:HD domain-containing protein [Actinoplanes sp. G11-F43]|uniref:HD domain-containing protein n=1 Tax=Actinoplanes sp. G11-F43 TaxID=3424130 RepID=UPI003D3549D1
MSTADFWYEVGALKRTTRSGWPLARMANRESVADHSFRTAVIAMTLAATSGADPDRAATLALLHDLPEARLGDLHHLARRYLNGPKPFQQVVEDQTATLPPAAREVIRARAAEWQSRESPEALIARDADILDSILHVRESLGDRPDLQNRWLTYLAASLTTDEARSLLTEITTTDPDDWWPRAVSPPGGDGGESR